MSERPNLTAAPWPEMAKPTSAEWLAWLDEQTPEGREWLVGRMLELAEDGGRCWTAQHDALFGELDRQRDALVREIRHSGRLHKAWRSARRRAFIANVPDPITRGLLREYVAAPAQPTAAPSAAGGADGGAGRG